MRIKVFISIILFCFVARLTHAQDHRLLVTHKGRQESYRVGDKVRLSYPANLLGIKSKKPIIGILCKIDSITLDKIWVNNKLPHKKQFELNTKDILAIKKSNSGSEIVTFIATYAIIGASTFLIIDHLDLNPAVSVFSSVAAIFPAVILTSNVFYPTKPNVNSKNNDYKLHVITIN